MPLVGTHGSRLGIRRAAPFIGSAAVVGLVLVVLVRAAGPLAAFEPEAGQLASGALAVAQTGASGGSVLKFGTPIPTPTPAQSAQACPAYPAFPDADCTGVPAGQTLATINGDLTITQDGAVVTNKLVTGGISVEANNVTIRNTWSYGGIGIRNWEGLSGLVIEDTEIGKAGVYPDTDMVANGNFTCRRCDIHSTTADGIKFSGSNVTLEDSYLHDFKYKSEAHNDGAQSTGINTALIRHNTFDGTSGQLTSGIMLGNEDAGLVNITIDQNLFRGIGNYGIYGGWNQDTGYQPVNTVFTNNRFEKGTFGYGTHVYVAPNSTWTNNAYTNGEVIPK